MHATRILRRCLSAVFDSMHATRRARLIGAVEALICGRRLTLTDLARSWVGALRMHAPLKALDRLLSNAHVFAAIVPLQSEMTAWVACQKRPVLLVDWSDLKGDGRWCLLRAAAPVRGRALTVYEMIFPLSRINEPSAQRTFLRELRKLLPESARPIMVTDAGFRSDWFRAVKKLGWDYVGRVRSNTHVQQGKGEWRACSYLHSLAKRTAEDLGEWLLVKGSPWPIRLVIAARGRKGRDQLTRKGTPQQSTTAKRARKAAREPWLLGTPLSADEFSAARLVALYAKRWQIETAFRDLKSHQYGAGFEDSQSRESKRLAVLLLLHALAAFAAWVAHLAARTDSVTLSNPITRQVSHQQRYSWYRQGWAWLKDPCRSLPHDRDLLRQIILSEISEIQQAWA
jgi:hypothetical protein